MKPNFATPVRMTLYEQAQARDVNEGPPEAVRHRRQFDGDRDLWPGLPPRFQFCGEHSSFDGDLHAE